MEKGSNMFIDVAVKAVVIQLVFAVLVIAGDHVAHRWIFKDR